MTLLEPAEPQGQLLGLNIDCLTLERILKQANNPGPDTTVRTLNPSATEWELLGA